MKWNRSFFAALTALAVWLPACGGNVPPPRTAGTPTRVTVRFRDGKVMPSQLELTSGGRITFVNDDGRPHQIYSSNCPELSSPVLGPRETVDAVVGPGPKTCKFQDLLAPTAVEYWGSVAVPAPAPGATVWYNPGSDGR